MKVKATACLRAKAKVMLFQKAKAGVEEAIDRGVDPEEGGGEEEEEEEGESIKEVMNGGGIGKMGGLTQMHLKTDMQCQCCYYVVILLSYHPNM